MVINLGQYNQGRGGKMEIIQKFKESEALIAKGEDKRACEILESIVQYDEIKDLAHFRLGEIYNRKKLPERSLFHHKKAFEVNEGLASLMLPKEHNNHHYRYHVNEEVRADNCPICEKIAIHHSVYNLVSDAGFVDGFDPVRLWMYCGDCHHVFANSYPKQLGELLTSDSHVVYLNPKMQMIPKLAEVVYDIKKMAKGNSYLEVGIGGGEMLAVAKEHGFDVEGVDIRPKYANKVAETLGLTVHAIDYTLFATDKKYHVIAMGDVLEHFTNPFSMIEKSYELLEDGGLFWISTPNFESAYSMYLKDKDPMWRTTQHINYFSYKSLKKILEKYHFDVIEYKSSSRFNGSMEIIAKK